MVAIEDREAKPAVWRRLLEIRAVETQASERVCDCTNVIKDLQAQIDGLDESKHKAKVDKLKVEMFDSRYRISLARGQRRWCANETRLTIDKSSEPIWDDYVPLRVPKTLAECKRSMLDPDEAIDEDLDSGQAVIITGITPWLAIVAAERATFGRRPDSVLKPFIEMLEVHGWRTPMSSAMAMAESVRAGGLVVPQMPVWLWAGIRSIVSRVLSRDIAMNEADHAVMVAALKDVADRATEDWLTAIGGKDAEINRELLKAEKELVPATPARKRKA